MKPRLDVGGGQGGTFRAQTFRGFLSRMGAALEAGTMPAAEDDAGLAGILAVHNAKEETMLYPMIDRQSTAEERQRVFSSMQGGTP